MIYKGYDYQTNNMYYDHIYQVGVNYWVTLYTKLSK